LGENWIDLSSSAKGCGIHYSPPGNAHTKAVAEATRRPEFTKL
jgi:hypothetical protein